jgi:hypothetical protein
VKLRSMKLWFGEACLPPGLSPLPCRSRSCFAASRRPLLALSLLDFACATCPLPASLADATACSLTLTHRSWLRVSRLRVSRLRVSRAPSSSSSHAVSYRSGNSQTDALMSNTTWLHQLHPKAHVRALFPWCSHARRDLRRASRSPGSRPRRERRIDRIALFGDGAPQHHQTSLARDCSMLTRRRRRRDAEHLAAVLPTAGPSLADRRLASCLKQIKLGATSPGASRAERPSCPAVGRRAAAAGGQWA